MDKVAFMLKNQATDEADTIVFIERTENGKLSLTFSSEDTPSTFIEVYGEEIRVLSYQEFPEEPEVFTLLPIAGD